MDKEGELIYFSAYHTHTMRAASVLLKRSAWKGKKDSWNLIELLETN